MTCSELRIQISAYLFPNLKFNKLDMHPLAAASHSRLLGSKRPIMRSALNVSLRKTRMSDIALNQSINQSINQLFYLQTHNLNKGDISRLQTNLKLTVLSNTKLRHF